MTNKFPETNIFENDQSILKDDDIDIVSIASYDNYHSNQIVNAINNRKHVMAEKPLCLNRNEMLEIFEMMLPENRCIAFTFDFFAHEVMNVM